MLRVVAHSEDHLVNLNRKKKNFPGIDLGDDHDRVAFQVTSSTTLDKVKSTVQQFMHRAYYNTFCRSRSGSNTT